MAQAPQVFDAGPVESPRGARLFGVQWLRERPNAAARAIIIAVALILAWLTWAHWGNIQIDCGRELYVPVEILRGKLLYRDIWYSYGPLAPYFQAFLIGIFGPHLNVLYLFGLTMAIACGLILFELGTMLEAPAAGLAAALALLFQGFGPPLWLQGFAPGIFNYVFPYAYAATLGLSLSLLCSLFVIRHVLGRAGCNLLLAGLAAGLALLAKPEFGLACYLMLAFVVLLQAGIRGSMRMLLKGLAACAPGIVLSGGVYGLVLWKISLPLLRDNWVGPPGPYFAQQQGRHLNAAAGLRFVPGEVLFLITSGLASVFFWYTMGRAAQRRRLRWTVVSAFFLLVAGIVRGRYLGEAAPLTQAPLLIGVLIAYPRGMLFIAIGLLAYALHQLRKQPRGALWLGEAALGFFAIMTAVRAFAEIGPYYYNIFYGAPLLLVFMIALGKSATSASRTLSGKKRYHLANWMLAAEVVTLAVLLIPVATPRTAKFQTSWGTLYTTPEDATSASQILAFMLEQKRKGVRVVVIPEAPIFYALTGMEAPDRWYTLLPGFLSPGYERSFIADIKYTHAHFILVTSRSFREYGTRYLGVDFGQLTYRWIESNYHVVHEFGHFERAGSLAALLYEHNRL